MPCVPDCNSESAYVHDSGSVQDGASEWTLDGSACDLSETICKVSFTYPIGDDLQRTAEPEVAVAGSPEIDPCKVLSPQSDTVVRKNGDTTPRIITLAANSDLP